MPGEALAVEAARLVAGRPPPEDEYDADIVILSLNRPAETVQAARSALQQRGGVFHITVLDQGSRPDALRDVRQSLINVANFSLYAVSRNLGVAGGRNLATSLGHGRIIVALDNDAVFAGRFVVARAVRRFAQTPGLGAIGFNVLRADGQQPDPFSWGYPAPLLARFKERFDTTTFVGAGHAIRRLTWNMAGGYDPSLFFTWEEYDFCLAAIALNWRICYDGSLEVIHMVSPEARIAWNSTRMTYFVRNRLIISRKWGASWLGLAPRMAGYIFKAFLNGQLEATIKGIREAYAYELPRRRPMPKAMRDYVYRNETRHRGSWIDRLRSEVFGRIQADP